MIAKSPDTIQAQRDDLRRQIGDLVQQFADPTYAPRPFQPDEPNPLAGYLSRTGLQASRLHRREARRVLRVRVLIHGY